MSGSSDQSTDLITFENKDELKSETFAVDHSPVSQTDSTSSSKSDVKRNYGRLCGYLNKLSSRGILKTFRRRWFVFSEDNCKLYYYRTSQDLVPLGEIDISKATFSLNVSNKAGFSISTPNKDYYLQANNQKTCLFWLQELQKFRRANSLLRTQLIRERSESVTDFVKQPESGLLGKSSSIDSVQCESEEALFMEPVDFPGDGIGDTPQDTNNKPLLLAQQKFSNLRNQVLNSVNAIRSSESSSRNTGDNISTSEKRLSGSIVQNSVFFDDFSTDDSLSKEVTPPSPSKKTPGLSAIRSRISESFRKQRASDDEEQYTSVRKPSKKYSCNKCHELMKKAQSMQEEIGGLQDEVSASRSVIKTLQKQLDIVLKEKETIIHLRQIDDSSDTLKILNSKDHEIVNLHHQVQELKQEIERLQQKISNLENSVHEKTDLYQELLQQKDSQIITLTNEIFDLETEKKDQEFKQQQNDSVPPSLPKLSESLRDSDNMEDLKDAVNAYELQNKFLNKELLELNQLRNDAEQREYALTMRCSEWEARCCQIQSKLLYLLKELEKPDAIGKSHEIVSRLLQEAVADGTDSSDLIQSWSFEKVYDDLGFNYKWGKDDLLSTKAANLKQRSDEIASKVKQDSESAALRARWDNFMVTLGNKDLEMTQELKLLLRQGIPKEYKGRIWKGCAGMRIKYLKLQMGPNYYDNLLNSEEYLSRLDPASKQIELDLLRTLPNNKHYEDLDADGIPKLRRVLLAYSRHDPVVGYCQGLNRLVAIMLLFMEEEDAFWCLVAIIKYLMPEGYYSRTLMASQVDQRVLKDLMAEKLSRVHAHLEQYKVDLSLFTFNWFLTVFIDNIPIETTLRIWDVFLSEGSKVLFRYALAFFKVREMEILALKEYIAINKYLRTISENMTDVKRLNQIAFGELNPFPQRMINVKRAQHMQIVKAELEELENLRNSLPRSVEKLSSTDCLSEED